MRLLASYCAALRHAHKTVFAARTSRTTSQSTMATDVPTKDESAPHQVHHDYTCVSARTTTPFLSPSTPFFSLTPLLRAQVAHQGHRREPHARRDRQDVPLHRAGREERHDPPRHHPLQGLGAQGREHVGEEGVQEEARARSPGRVPPRQARLRGRRGRVQGQLHRPRRRSRALGGRREPAQEGRGRVRRGAPARPVKNASFLSETPTEIVDSKTRGETRSSPAEAWALVHIRARTTHQSTPRAPPATGCDANTTHEKEKQRNTRKAPSTIVRIALDRPRVVFRST